MASVFKYTWSSTWEAKLIGQFALKCNQCFLLDWQRCLQGQDEQSNDTSENSHSVVVCVVLCKCMCEWCMQMLVYMYMGVAMCMEARERPQESWSILATLFPKTGSLTQPGACHFSYRLHSQPDPASLYLLPLPPTPSAGITPGFCVDVRDPNPSPHETSPGNFILFCLVIWGMGGETILEKIQSIFNKMCKNYLWARQISHENFLLRWDFCNSETQTIWAANNRRKI